MEFGMGRLKQGLIGAGFAAFKASGLHRLAARVTRGQGAILMFHHVRPATAREFNPNGLLEITPEFFDAVLTRVKALGFEIVSLDEAVSRLGRSGDKPFVALTFDDGYRDNAEFALPILQKHDAPFTLFVTTGFDDRSARLWWVELEEAIRRLDGFDIEMDGIGVAVTCKSDAEKAAAFNLVYTFLRNGPEQRLLDEIARLCALAGVDGLGLVAELCLDWDGLVQIAQEPLCTIGCHTLTHPMLAKHGADFTRTEMAKSREMIAARLGQPVRHFAYPVGDPTSAGVREFALAKEIGFASAVTTRPGMLFAEHADHLQALPRLSINGLWQDVDYVEVLLSGAPFALWNRGRRLNVA
jgi:peptidoglycan/xylan/chitin deacetylase (PgdA/CDA1 family)